MMFARQRKVGKLHIALEEGESSRLPVGNCSEPGTVRARCDESANMALRRGLGKRKSGFSATVCREARSNVPSGGGGQPEAK